MIWRVSRKFNRAISLAGGDGATCLERVVGRVPVVALLVGAALHLRRALF